MLETDTALEQAGDHERMANSKQADRMLRQFGKRLQAVRLAAGYETAAALADELGQEPPTYRRYERGDSMPPIDILELIVKITNTTSDFLLFGTSPRR